MTTAKKTFKPAKQSWILRVPANATGDRFIHQFKSYMNDDSYSVNRRYTGPRHHKNAAFTRKEDAISVRLYVNAKGENGERVVPSPYSTSTLIIENMMLKRKLKTLERIFNRSLNISDYLF